MTDVTYETEIKDKEDLDFKVEIGKNKDGDKVILVYSKNPLEKDYTKIVETLATEWNRTFEELPKRTELEQLKMFIVDTSLPLLKAEIDSLNKIVERLEGGEISPRE